MLRRATPFDAEAIAAVTAEGFAGYHSFAAAGWDPPAPTVAETYARLAAPGAWAMVACDDDEVVVGVGAYEPARGGVTGPATPGLAHIWAVFVTEAHWGTGAATALLAAMMAAIADAGFTEARLYAAAGQARARRFYAREGWTEVAEPFGAPELGLDLVEMRREV
jgi:GNAT superfamily N-acetyltransferase